MAPVHCHENLKSHIINIFVGVAIEFHTWTGCSWDFRSSVWWWWLRTYGIWCHTDW